MMTYIQCNVFNKNNKISESGCYQWVKSLYYKLSLAILEIKFSFKHKKFNN